MTRRERDNIIAHRSARVDIPIVNCCPPRTSGAIACGDAVGSIGSGGHGGGRGGSRCAEARRALSRRAWWRGDQACVTSFGACAQRCSDSGDWPDL
eukprot:scaffold235142_cov33-Tisochrysis_lutea.AAC.3